MMWCHNFQNLIIGALIFSPFAAWFFTEKNASVEEDNCFSQPVSPKKVTWWSNINTKSLKCFASDRENILKERKCSGTPDSSNSNQDSTAKGPLTPEGQPSLTLASNQVYKFQSGPIGHFHIRGGHTGDITVTGHRVSIWDAQDNLIFSKGSTNDRIKVTDDHRNEVTTITLISGEEENGDQKDQDEGIWDRLWGIFFGKNKNINKNSESNIFIQINGIDYSSPSSKQKHDGDIKNKRPLQIVGQPNEQIILRGGCHRTAIVNGNGGHLTQAGKQSVTVFGDLQSATQAGTGNVKVNGNVKGTVLQSGMGSVTVVGNGEGNVKQSGVGNVKIEGNVNGRVEQSGVGKIVIYGDGGVKGRVRQSGVGSIQILGDVWNSVEASGAGSIKVNGNVMGRFSSSGAGSVKINGNVMGGIGSSGAGSVKINGNVFGGISSSGAGRVEINGDLDGDIRCSGAGSVEVRGTQMNGGRIFKKDNGKVYVRGK